jgi:Kazal-type serine protease inhibitor domain
MRVSTLVALILLSGTILASAMEYTRDGKTYDVPVCGGFLGIQCSPKQWCHFPMGASCGRGDQFGTCQTRPEFCPDIFMPVCGCDNKTYPNACSAARAGFDVAYLGPCRTGP